jgi:hypothetical protein
MKKVIVNFAPISERYWSKGCEGLIDEKNKQIRVTGCWFSFDERWSVE